jgi:hypothetical protein
VMSHVLTLASWDYISSRRRYSLGVESKKAVVSPRTKLLTIHVSFSRVILLVLSALYIILEGGKCVCGGLKLVSSLITLRIIQSVLESVEHG